MLAAYHSSDWLGLLEQVYVTMLCPEGVTLFGRIEGKATLFFYLLS